MWIKFFNWNKLIQLYKIIIKNTKKLSILCFQYLKTIHFVFYLHLHKKVYVIVIVCMVPWNENNRPSIDNLTTKNYGIIFNLQIHLIFISSWISYIKDKFKMELEYVKYLTSHNIMVLTKNDRQNLPAYYNYYNILKYYTISISLLNSHYMLEEY